MDTIEVLAQSFPLADTLTDLYEVPVGKSCVISSVTICNQSASGTRWRLAIAPGGAGDDDAQYLYYDLPHAGNDTFIATIGITLAAGDVVRVYADDAVLSFNLFGVLV